MTTDVAQAQPASPALDEQLTFRLYYLHQQGCPRCYPAAAQLCARGTKLHNIWKRAEAAMVAAS